MYIESIPPSTPVTWSTKKITARLHGISLLRIPSAPPCIFRSDVVTSSLLTAPMNIIRDQGMFQYEMAEGITLEEFLRGKNP
jgi:hypothetical protein